jgi:hypothetical protein
MQRLLAATIALSTLSGPAEAELLSRTVPAGRTSTVFTYKPQTSCRSAFAVAKLSVKPQHGRVSHNLTPAIMPSWNRITGRPTGCDGKPTTGFAVTYTPAPGFHGFDTFTLDVDFKETGRQIVDVFTINVE